MDLFTQLLLLYGFVGVINVIINNDIREGDSAIVNYAVLIATWPCFLMVWVAFKLGLLDE